MADTKISATAQGVPASSDLVPFANLSAGPATQAVTVSNLSAMALIAELTASSSASLDFLTRNVGNFSGALFQSDFDVYEIEVVSLVPATSAAALLLRMSTDGATFDATSGHYSWAALAMAFNATGVNGSQSDTAIQLFNDMNNAANTSQSGRWTLTNPLSTALYKTVFGTASQTDHSRTTDSLAVTLAGKYLVAGSAVVGCRCIASSGNLASGTIRIYGIRK